MRDLFYGVILAVIVFYMFTITRLPDIGANLASLDQYNGWVVTDQKQILGENIITIRNPHDHSKHIFRADDLIFRDLKLGEKLK